MSDEYRDGVRSGYYWPNGSALTTVQGKSHLLRLNAQAILTSSMQSSAHVLLVQYDEASMQWCSTLAGYIEE
jgi:hypothetical protein